MLTYAILIYPKYLIIKTLINVLNAWEVKLNKINNILAIEVTLFFMKIICLLSLDALLFSIENENDKTAPSHKYKIISNNCRKTIIKIRYKLKEFIEKL